MKGILILVIHHRNSIHWVIDGLEHRKHLQATPFDIWWLASNPRIHQSIDIMGITVDPFEWISTGKWVGMIFLIANPFKLVYLKMAISVSENLFWFFLLWRSIPKDWIIMSNFRDPHHLWVSDRGMFMGIVENYLRFFTYRWWVVFIVDVPQWIGEMDWNSFCRNPSLTTRHDDEGQDEGNPGIPWFQDVTICFENDDGHFLGIYQFKPPTFLGQKVAIYGISLISQKQETWLVACDGFAFEVHENIMQVLNKESKFDSPLPLVFDVKTWIRTLHNITYSTICIIKSFLNFNVHILPEVDYGKKNAAEQNISWESHGFL